MNERLAAPSERDRDDLRWRMAVDYADVGVWDVDLAAGTSYYSPAWKRMLGYEAHEIEDCADLWLTFMHPEDRDEVTARVADLMAGKTESLEQELRMRHRDGRWIWVLDRGRVVTRDEAGRVTRLVGVHIDISARKAAMLESQFAHRRLELSLEASGIGIWHYEPLTNRVVLDARAKAIYGFAPGHEATLEDWRALIHPEDRVRAEAPARKLVPNGPPIPVGYRILPPGGAMRHIAALNRYTILDDGTPVVVGIVEDVTEEVNRHEAISAEREWLRVTLRSIGDAVIAADAAGLVTFANPAAEKLLLRSEATMLGQAIADVLPLAGAIETRAERSSGGENGQSFTLLRLDGSQGTIRKRAARVLNAAGEAIGEVVVVQDVTHEHARQQELAHAARHDALTGLLNRAAFDEVLGEALRAVRPDRPTALFYIDLDRFKMVNDTVGHAAGDAMLRLVVQALRATLPAGAHCARLGGDEFALLLECADGAAAQVLAGRVIAAIGAQRLVWKGQAHQVGASVGIAMLADVEPESVAALSAADAACYAAKSEGRNRAVLFAPGGGGRELAGVRAASDLLEALSQGRLVLFAQEIRDLFDAQAPCRHAEVLARLSAPDGSIIPPHRFIPAAERFDLMMALDHRVIRDALTQFAASGVPTNRMTLSINLSAASLSDDGLWSFVAETMAQTGIPPQALCFEITETASVANFDAAERFVRTAQGAGCRISLDDFGSGLSSFAYLKRFPVDSIKIDGAFVEEVGRNPFDQAICAAIGSIAAGFGVDVVAERIEDPESLSVLRARGISHGQGFLLHRPEPLSDLLARRRPIALVS